MSAQPKSPLDDLPDIDVVDEEEHEDSIPRFPSHLLPPVMRAVVEATPRAYRTSVELAAMPAMAAVSTACGGGIRLKTGLGSSVAPNLFFLAFAPSASGKGEGMKPTMKPLFEADAERSQKFQAETLPAIEADLEMAEIALKEARKEGGNRTGIVEAKEKIAALKEMAKKEPHLVADDITREAMAEVMSHQPFEAIGLITSEARGAIAILKGRYNNGKSSDEDLYLKAYSGDPTKVLRRSTDKAAIVLSNPTATLYWAVQPDKKEELYGDRAFDDGGLLPRFLPASVEDTAEEPVEEIPATVTLSWQGCITEALKYHDREEAAVVEMTRDAAGVLKAFADRTRDGFRDGKLKAMRPYAARWAENAYRLALNFHVCRYGEASDSTDLGPEDASAAVIIVQWFGEHQKQILAAGQEDSRWARFQKLRDILAREQAGRRTLRLLRKNNNFQEEEVRDLIGRFPGKVEIIKQQAETGGQPSVFASLICK